MGMFGARTEQAGEPQEQPGALSIVAVGMTIRGDIESSGTVKIEGVVDGQVRAKSQVLVAKGGLVRGDIETREAIIGGSVQGAVFAEERVELQPGSSVAGDITTRRILVAEGGSINGLIRMGEAALEGRPVPVREPKGAAGSSASSAARPSVPVARVAVPPRSSSTGF